MGGYFISDFDDAGASGCRNSKWGDCLKEHALMSYQENDPEKQRSSCDYYADYDSTIEALRDELESGRQNTDKSKPGSRDPAHILPAWIFCLQRNRSPVKPIRFENCAAESDLPERLFFGELVPGSFKQLPTGFSARYASSYINTVVTGNGVKLQFEVKIERSDPYYHACHCSNVNWNPGLLFQLTATKSDLDKALKSVLESDFNVRYKCGELGKDLGQVCYVPDGYAVSILIPFPMNDESFSHLGRFVHATMDGPEVFCHAQLEQQVIVTNYRETKCPDLKLEPKELLVHDIDRGLIPYAIPEWEIGFLQSDGLVTSWSSRPICLTWAVFSNICAIAISFKKLRQLSNLLIFTMRTLQSVWNPVRVSQGIGQEE